mmetsp:Transcript_13380/g.19136  ORF Transcript_13380/g.19136 Transcript_13380/m.19136 type:complete len:182 (-) Transcript_13380:278-823(-)
MLPAYIILLWSLDSEKKADNVQFSTISKLRSQVSNFNHTVPGGMGITFVTTDGKGMTQSKSPTNSFWFKRFILGCHKRMGGVWVSDRPITVHEVLQVLKTQKKKLNTTHADDSELRLEILLTALLFVVGFTSALRGKEVIKVDIGGTRHYWNKAVNHHSCPHIPLVLAGRLKGEKTARIFI